LGPVPKLGEEDKSRHRIARCRFVGLAREQNVPGNTLSGWFFSKLRTKALAVMLKICLGVKFTPSLTWKLNPPAMAPGNEMNQSVKLSKTSLKVKAAM